MNGSTHDAKRVLVLGASGYVGARLVPRLVRMGHFVRAAGRSRASLEKRSWKHDPAVELCVADARDPASLSEAMRGVDIVYSLVHAMGGPTRRGFAADEHKAARVIAATASAAGVKRIIYLGGLGNRGAALSEHLQSRHDMGDILREGSVPVIELQAAVILGAGSAAFEILRYLTDRLPVMVAPRWVSTPLQPIAIDDALAYLAASLDAPQMAAGGVYEIGGPDVITYRKLMQIYAEEAGLRKRLIVPVPVLTPRLSSYWIHLVTPAPASLAQPLAEGLRNPVVVHHPHIRHIIPRDLVGARQAIRRALDPRQRDAPGPEVRPDAWLQPGDANWTGGTVIEDARKTTVPGQGSPEMVRESGKRDVWMRLPGDATVELHAATAPGGVRIEQRARYYPRGLLGLLAGYAVRPLERVLMRRRLRHVARRAARPR